MPVNPLLAGGALAALAALAFDVTTPFIQRLGSGVGPLGTAALLYLAAALFAAGVTLHLTERHGHAHVHPALSHDHAHLHDDGHHDHTHEPPVVGAHAPPHAHELRAHTHPHDPDLHHGHEH